MTTSPTDRTAARHGFSLLELLVVVTLVGVLVGLLLPAVQAARQSAARLACSNQLRNFALAVHQHHDAAGRLPAGTEARAGSPYRFLGWMPRLLPYLEQDALWTRAEADYRSRPFFALPQPHTLLSFALRDAICPSDATAASPRQVLGLTVALSSYQGVAGRDQFKRDGVLFADSAVPLTAITDGTSSTLLVGEQPASLDYRFGWWYAGIGQNRSGSLDHTLGAAELNSDGGRRTYPICPAGPYRFRRGTGRSSCAVFHFWSLHPGGANFAFCDGSVRFLPYSADGVLPALATRAGGETVAPPD